MDRYWSPYPIIDMELPDPSGSDYGFTKVSRGVRSHIRTSDLLMGSLGKHHGVSTLWVCHFCFKYMTDGGLLELHKVCLLWSSISHFSCTAERMQTQGSSGEESLSKRSAYNMGG